MDTSNIPFFTQAKPKDMKFTWPVFVPVPGEGKYDQVEFKAVFLYMDDAAEKAMLAENLSDDDIAKRVLIGVELKDADGKAVPSTPELVEQMLAVDRMGPAVTLTYLNARRGMALTKNS